MVVKLVSFILFGSGLLQYVNGGTSKSISGIPTTEEQMNLLLNVQEVFEYMKVLVKDEGKATDTAVVNDLNKIVGRAQDKLGLIEELTLVKLVCSNKANEICVQNAKPEIQKVIQEGENVLEECAVKASDEIEESSSRVSNDTYRAAAKGQTMLDSLEICSHKPTLHQIPCYKKIMNHDVVPVKLILLEAMDSHRNGHLKAISIRDKANKCVDEAMNKYQAKVAQILADALTCITT